MKTGLIAAIWVGCLTLGINAQTQIPGIDQTQRNQRERIRQGVQSGQLTNPDARKLKKEQKRIQREKRIAKANGFISKRERKIIKHEQKIASRHIYQKKHHHVTY